MVAINKQDLINYLKKSPENLNFNIFGTMLDDFRNTYETDEQVVDKIKNIITNIIEDGGSISPEDDTITELVDLVTELLPEKMIIKPVGTLEITENGTHDVTEYASVVVNTPQPSSTIEITENGTYDVAQYAEANVNTPQPSGTIEITENGEYDVAEYANTAVNVSSGGDNSDLINLIERDITTLNIPDGTTNIGNYAFQGCHALTSLEIPNSVTSISNNAFYQCYALASLTIPDSVTNIGERAFGSCYNLTSLEIPNSVTSIGNYAFNDCSSLTDVYFTGTESEWGAISIGMSNDALINATKHFNYTP